MSDVARMFKDLLQAIADDLPVLFFYIDYLMHP